MNRWHTFEDLSEAQSFGAKALGAGVRTARLRVGMSQQQVAWQVGVSQSVISRLENGRLRGIRFRTLAVIAGALGMGPEWLVEGGPGTPTRRMPGQPGVR